MLDAKCRCRSVLRTVPRQTKFRIPTARVPAPIIQACVLREACHRCLSTLRCSSPGCGWPSRSRRRGFGGAAARWRRAAPSWDWCCTLRTCTTDCAAPRPTAIWNFRELAAKLGLPFHEARVDTARPKRRPIRKSGKAAETIEEAARRLRYSWFRATPRPKLRSMQSRLRTRSTTRPKRFWPSFCAERGRRAWQASLQNLKPRRAPDSAAAAGRDAR